MKKLSKVMMAGIAGLMLLSGPAAGAPRELHQFAVVMTDDIEAELDSNLINVGKKATRTVQFQCTPSCTPFTLGAFWTEDVSGPTSIYANETNGSECFPPSFPPPDLRSNVQGAIHLSERKNGDAQAAFWFTGKLDDGDGDSESKYLLILTDDEGWLDNGQPTAFPPPDIHDTITMTFDPNDLWEMQTEGKGKLRLIACKGMGMDAEVTIVLTRIVIL